MESEDIHDKIKILETTFCITNRYQTYVYQWYQLAMKKVVAYILILSCISSDSILEIRYLLF